MKIILICIVLSIGTKALSQDSTVFQKQIDSLKKIITKQKKEIFTLKKENVNLIALIPSPTRAAQWLQYLGYVVVSPEEKQEGYKIVVVQETFLRSPNTYNRTEIRPSNRPNQGRYHGTLGYY